MAQITVNFDTDMATAIDACRISMARENYLSFVDYMFRADGRQLLIGQHTRALAERIDRALDDLFLRGISTRCLCSVPYRHGKSDLFSRFLAPYVIGKYGTEPFKTRNNLQNIMLEFMQMSYASGLSDKLSRQARQILTHPAYQRVFPGVALSPEAKSMSDWETVDTNRPPAEQRLVTGRMQSMGVGGSAAGMGATILSADDIIKNREEAENENLREKAWVSLKDDFLTRLAPQHIVFLVGTRWHMDDPIGRILAKNDPESPDYDPEFPDYETLMFKARQDDGTYLFSERFSDQWYEDQFASLGSYSAAALLQSEPIARGGNLLPVDNIQYVDSVPPAMLLNALQCRFWDLASSDKEQIGDDPDYTAGMRGFIWFDGASKSDSDEELKQKSFFVVTDLRLAQATALQRNQLIMDTARGDGPTVHQGIEAVGGYKDAATSLKTILKGISVVHKINVHRSKYIRIEALEPVMAAGRIIFVRGWWNAQASQQCAQFPSGKHDDIPDALSGLYQMAWDRAVVALRSGYVNGSILSSGRGLVRKNIPTPKFDVSKEDHEAAKNLEEQNVIMDLLRREVSREATQ